MRPAFSEWKAVQYAVEGGKLMGAVLAMGGVMYLPVRMLFEVELLRAGQAKLETGQATLGAGQAKLETGQAKLEDSVEKIRQGQEQLMLKIVQMDKRRGWW